MADLKWNKAFALEQAADDEELLVELMDIFKESSANDFSQIEEGLAEKNADKICSAAHSIKGASASLGVESIRDIAMAIESDSRSGSVAVAEEKIETLKELINLLQEL